MNCSAVNEQAHPSPQTRVKDTLAQVKKDEGKDAPAQVKKDAHPSPQTRVKDTPAPSPVREPARKDEDAPSPVPEQAHPSPQTRVKDTPAPSPSPVHEPARKDEDALAQQHEIHEPVTPRPVSLALQADDKSLLSSPIVSTPLPVREPVKEQPKELFKVPSAARLNMSLAERIADRYLRVCDDDVSFQDFAREEYGVMYTIEDVKDIFKYLDEKIQRSDSKPSLFSEIGDDDVLIFVPSE